MEWYNNYESDGKALEVEVGDLYRPFQKRADHKKETPTIFTYSPISQSIIHRRPTFISFTYVIFCNDYTPSTQYRCCA